MTFRNIPELSRTFQNFPEHSRTFRNIPELSGTFRNIPGDSRTFPHIPWISCPYLIWLVLSYLIGYDPYLILSYLWWAVFAQNNTEVIPMSDNGCFEDVPGQEILPRMHHPCLGSLWTWTIRSLVGGWWCPWVLSGRGARRWKGSLGLSRSWIWLPLTRPKWTCLVDLPDFFFPLVLLEGFRGQIYFLPCFSCVVTRDHAW